MFHAFPRSMVLLTKARWRARSRVVTKSPLVSTFRLRLYTASFSSSRNPFTSRTTRAKEVDLNQENEESIFLLYQRNPERNGLPRSAFLVSSLNSLYWIWYVFDFVPAVNSSPIPELHMDPAYGFFGLGLSVMIHSVFTLYPLSLVSKLDYDPVMQRVRLWRHSLPWVRPSKIPTPIPLGDITMDKASSDTTKILTDLAGDVHKYQGHLGVTVGKGILPFLVEIRQPEEIYNSQLFLEVLLDPQRLKHQRTTPSPPNTTKSPKGQPPPRAQKGRKNQIINRTRRK
jgi:hypothetical protein